jgi:hypothetical protein
MLFLVSVGGKDSRGRVRMMGEAGGEIFLCFGSSQSGGFPFLPIPVSCMKIFGYVVNCQLIIRVMKHWNTFSIVFGELQQRLSIYDLFLCVVHRDCCGFLTPYSFYSCAFPQRPQCHHHLAISCFDISISLVTVIPFSDNRHTSDLRLPRRPADTTALAVTKH